MNESLKSFNLEEDIADSSINQSTSYGITTLSAAQNNVVNAFTAEYTSTGYLSNAQGNSTSTPLSSAFVHLATYFFSSTAGNTVPVAQNTNSTTSIIRVLQVGRTTLDDGLVSGTITAVMSFGTSGNNIFIDVPETTITASVGRKGSMVSQSSTTNIVGTIFYDAGVVIFHGGTGVPNFLITSVSGFQFGAGSTAGTVAVNQFSFQSYNVIKRTSFFCRATNKQFNYTNNITSLSDTTKGTITSSLTSMPTTYVTSVGLYSASGDLLAVAKVSPPVKKDFSREFILSVRINY